MTKKYENPYLFYRRFKAATIYSIQKLSPSLSRFPITLSNKLVVPNSRERVDSKATNFGFAARSSLTTCLP